MVRRIITVVVVFGIGFLLALAYFAVCSSPEWTKTRPTAVASTADRTSPALNGRVVDAANILSANERAVLESKLGALESQSGIQLVVASVTSLGGQEIEPFANALFRAWKLGDAKKNNGVLFLIAPNEHRLRIEVGYGLEGTLTDAASKIITANAVTPRFKAGDFNGGVDHGVDDIIGVLTPNAIPVLRTNAADRQEPRYIPAIHATHDAIHATHELTTWDGYVLMLNLMLWIIPISVLLGLILWIAMRLGGASSGQQGSSGWRGSSDRESFSRGGGSSGGGASDSGSFSGGGGSSGGGGASDRW